MTFFHEFYYIRLAFSRHSGDCLGGELNISQITAVTVKLLFYLLPFSFSPLGFECSFAQFLHSQSSKALTGK